MGKHLMLWAAAIAAGCGGGSGSGDGPPGGDGGDGGRGSDAAGQRDFAQSGDGGGGDAAQPPGGEWPTFLHDPQHTSANPGETAITKANAASLKKLWTVDTGQVIAASPSVVGGVVYLGSWDGNLYALDAGSGKPAWTAPLGTTTIQAGCNDPYPSTMGITSSATIAGGVIYIGGGDLNWYALDAASGKVQWQVGTVPMGQQPDGYYNYASPLVIGGSAYVGTSSSGNCPSTVGGILSVGLAQQKRTGEWDAVPAGQIGGPVWSSPAADPDGSALYVATGEGDAGDYTTQPYTLAIVKLDAQTLAPKGAFQIPQSDFVNDPDFGASPTVFDDANGRKLVGDACKNGFFYAVDRETMQLAWKVQLDAGGSDPITGQGSISSAAFANDTVYVGAGNSTVGGQGYEGALTAIVASTGKVKWAHGAPGVLMGPVTWANGMVFYGTGSANGGEAAMLEVLDDANGNPLLSIAPAPSGQVNFISGGVTVSGGRLFFGHSNGTIYGYGL